MNNNQIIQTAKNIKDISDNYRHYFNIYINGYDIEGMYWDSENNSKIETIFRGINRKLFLEDTYKVYEKLCELLNIPNNFKIVAPKIVEVLKNVIDNFDSNKFKVALWRTTKSISCSEEHYVSVSIAIKDYKGLFTDSQEITDCEKRLIGIEESEVA